MLVIGIGNTDRGDDGAGIAVARRLAGMPGLRVAENAGDALALLDAWEGAERVILVDAAAPDGAPGRVRRLDGAAPLPRELGLGSTHAFGLAQTIELARTLGRLPKRLEVIAIEGERFDTGAELSAPVAAAVARVAEHIMTEAAHA